jgi:hypothetical protein
MHCSIELGNFFICLFYLTNKKSMPKWIQTTKALLCIDMYPKTQVQSDAITPSKENLNMQNSIMAKLHYTNKLANNIYIYEQCRSTLDELCNITNELVGLWQDQRPASCTTYWALVLPEPSKLTNKLAQWSLSANKLYKFVSGAPTSWQLVGQLVRVVWSSANNINVTISCASVTN